MAAPTSSNEVTARRLASFATSLWTKIKAVFAPKENGVYYVPGTSGYANWSANTAYAVGANVVNPSGECWTCKTAHTSGSSWSSTNWNRISAVALTGTIDGVTALYAGLKIAYRFQVLGGEGSTTLNVNNLGAKTITRGTGAFYRWTIGRNGVAILVYDGSAWRFGDYDSNDQYVLSDAYCSTAAGTQAKAATSTGFNYSRHNNIPFRIYFTNTNTYDGNLTLNVNSQGAKPLWINGFASSSSNKTISVGVYWCYFDGTQFQLWTDKSLPCPAGMRGDVTGTAAYASNAAPNSDLAALLNGFGSSISGLMSAVGGKAALDQNPSRVVYYGTTTKDELIAIIDAGYQPICYYTQSAGGSAWFTYSGKKNGYYFFYAPILWQGVVRTQWLACHSESGNTVWEYAYIDMTADGAAVADVNYDSTYNKITKTKNGQTNDVTSLQEMLQHLPSSSDDVPRSLDGSAYVLPMRGNSTTGQWFMKPLGSIWNWIKWKIEEVLGLTASQYNGNAATASGYAQSGGIASALAAKSAIDHTHSIFITTTSENPILTFAPNTAYTLNAGGSSVSFKTQAGPFFATYGLTTYGDFLAAYLAGSDMYVSYQQTSGGGSYYYIQKPQIFASEFNSNYQFFMIFSVLNVNTGASGVIAWSLDYSNGWRHLVNGTWESGATTSIFTPIDFYAPNLATKTDLNSYATTASLANYATLNDLAGVSRYGGQHVSCLLRVVGSWNNTIEGKVYDARGYVVKTIGSAGSIPALVNQTSDVTELFIKVTSSYSGTGTIGFYFGDIASEKPLRIHVRNSSGYTFRIVLRKGSAETTCTFYTATAAEAATSFNMDTSANGTSDWVVMVSGVENNSCYVINRI